MNGRWPEGRLAFILCTLAALRVFVFSAAFPFFSNVDEQSHFDLLHKYSRGHIPGGLEHWDADAARLILLYGSPEYFETPDRSPGGAFAGPRQPESAEDRAAFEREVATVVASDNHESTQPPVYYLVAGAWYRTLTWLGLRGIQALYGTRFLNVFVFGAVTWLAYVFTRAFFPENAFVRLGVPLLVAFFPQDVFYAINNDVLLPLLTGAAFLGLVGIARGSRTGLAVHIATGLAVAGAFLVKFSSVALLPVAGAMVVAGALRRPRSDCRQALTRAGVLVMAAFVPIGAWCARSYLLMGDATASAGKIQFLGWTRKPVAALLDHPIFTPSGILTFWRGTLATFWRGELVWGLRPIASPGWDAFFAASSFVLIVVAVTAPAYVRKPAGGSDRFVLWSCLALFSLSIGFLAAISVAYDFGACFYPSRAVPFLTSGRLACGALIPFAVLYVSGLDALLPRSLPAPLRWAVLIVPVILMTISEILMNRVAFHSPYNWFHTM